MKLNPQQLAAITYLDGPLFVLAGAGSGKTRVIIEKIAHLIAQGHPAQNIAAITFTNKAAHEMQERIEQTLPKSKTRGLTISTFHSLGMKILREDASLLGYKKNFSILDAADSSRIIAELLQSTGREPLFRAKSQISLWKNSLLSPDEVKAQNGQSNDAWLQTLIQVYASYEQTLKSYHAIDFDDLIRLPTLLLQTHSAIRHKWQLRLRYLLIDECQDTNTCQYQLMRLLVGSEGRFTAVGDDDQSIYAWRGADMENLRRLQTDYPELKIIKLEQNYRSTSRILKVANQVIANNPKLFEKTLWSDYGMGERIRIAACQSEQHEAEWVAGQIRFLHNQSASKRPYHDFAILYRSNYQARIFEEALRSLHIPYRISGGQSFFERTEIKDILAYLRLIANPADDPAFLRAITTPKRGIGEASLAILNQYAQQHQQSLYEATQHPLAQAELSPRARGALSEFITLIEQHREAADRQPAGEVIDALLEAIHYEAFLQEHETEPAAQSKWRNVQDLAKWLRRKGEQDQTTLIELTQTIALITLLEGREDGEAPDAVHLSTLHAAKGLEYPYVFLVGCEEGIFPSEQSLDEGKLAEERRLMYVGITRAKYYLTISHCVKRKRQGAWQFPEPSRFIDEMPQEDLQILGRKNSEPLVSLEEGRQQFSQLRQRIQIKKAQP